MPLSQHHKGIKMAAFRRGGLPNPPGQGIALSLLRGSSRNYIGMNVAIEGTFVGEGLSAAETLPPAAERVTSF
jgi:hypothetical protein